MLDERFSYLVMKFLHHKVNQTIRDIILHMVKNINQQLRKAFSTDLELLTKSDNENDRIISDLLEDLRNKLSLDEDTVVNDIVTEHIVSNKSINKAFSSFHKETLKDIERLGLYPYMKDTDPELYEITGGEVYMIKLRSVFDSLDEAKPWCERMRNEKEPHIEILPTIVGAWVPFGGNTEVIPEKDHANKQLAESMRKYYENLHLKNQFESKKTESDRELLKKHNVTDIKERLRRKYLHKNQDKIKEEFKEFHVDKDDNSQ